MADDLHEARVREFLASAQLADPERFAAVCARNPVKSKRQMRTIAETEITAGLHPIRLRRLHRPPASHRSNHWGGPAERRYEVVAERAS